ncbi:unnamed protein product [Ectocarpus sp. CCAP 1310/34]|nr:unnamed protein product [Ectocarpus sp. CCAP 1310/34]
MGHADLSVLRITCALEVGERARTKAHLCCLVDSFEAGATWSNSSFRNRVV